MIYLASPYTDLDPHVVEYRVRITAKLTYALWKRGFTVFSPIVHSAGLIEYTPQAAKQEHAWWMAHDIVLLEVAEALWVHALPGWSASRGVQHEIQWWHKAGRREPVRVVDFSFVFDRAADLPPLLEDL